MLVARALESHTTMVMLIGSYGATTAVLFLLSDQKVAAPKVVLFAHVVSVLTGLLMRELVSPYAADLAIVLAVSGAITLMKALSIEHPPGGAVAFIAVTAPDHLVADPLVFALGTAVLGPSLYLGLVHISRRIFAA